MCDINVCIYRTLFILRDGLVEYTFNLYLAIFKKNTVHISVYYIFMIIINIYDLGCLMVVGRLMGR